MGQVIIHDNTFYDQFMFTPPKRVVGVKWERQETDGTVSISECRFDADGTVRVDAEAFRELMRHAGFSEVEVTETNPYANGGVITTSGNWPKAEIR